MLETLITVAVLGTILYVVYHLINGDSLERSLPMIMLAIIGLVVILPMMGLVSNEFPVMFQFQIEPECIQEGLVDCELYNIPLDECNRDVIEEGPYYDVRTITKYTKFTCMKWDDGSMIQP